MSPSVFSVGPGLSTTYGTSTRAPTMPSASTRKPETRRVNARRDMGPSLFAGAYPLGRPVGELLMFPDRHLGLEVVDQPARGLERLLAVRAGGGHDHRSVAERQVADPVDGGERGHGEVGGHLLGHGAQLALGGGVGGVGQLRHRLALVVVTHGAHEHGGAAGGMIAHRGHDLVDRQRGVTKSEQPDDVHVKSLQISHVRRFLRTWWTMAAVPMTATVAPAAVSVASLTGSRLPTTVVRFSRSSRSWTKAASFVHDGFHPASRSPAQSTTHG